MSHDIEIHPHARERAIERGTSEAEIVATVETGERFVGKHGRTGFRRIVPFGDIWRGKRYTNKQIEVFAVEENDRWIVITVLVKFF
jgi:hypothetical protein